MNIKQYAREAIRTLPDLGNRTLNNIHMVFGLVTEVAELADVYKKYLAYSKKVDLVNVQEEVGDIMWYLSNFCEVNGFDLEEIMDRNIAKLKVRYPEKFTEHNALNRDLDKEREILEG